MKMLVVGDIHGCLVEFRELLDKAGITADDEIIALGDITDRGPASTEVINFFMTHSRVKSVLGTHERKHLRGYREGKGLAFSQVITRWQAGAQRYPAFCEFFGQLPLFIELPEAILIHGALEPGLPVKDQKEIVVTGSRAGEAYLKEHYPGKWYEYYRGEKPLIVGHRDYSGKKKPFIYKNMVFGIDTRVYEAGFLTGLVLPDFKFISIRARENHREKMEEKYAALKLTFSSYEALKWTNIRAIAKSAGAMEGIPVELAAQVSEIVALNDRMDEALLTLQNHIIKENNRVLAELRKTSAFDSLPEAGQRKHYFSRVQNPSLKSPLYNAYRQSLDLEVLGRRFKRPEKFIEFVANLKIPG